MTERPWLAAYPEGVPARIDPDQYASLKALLEQSFARNGEAPAFENLGVVLTYTETERLSRQIAAYFQSRSDFSPGDRVAVMMPNLLQYPVTVFGLLRAGLTVVNVNPLYTPRELMHQLENSGARAIIVLENFAATVEAVIDRVDLDLVIVTRIGDHLPRLKGWATNFVVKHIKKLVPAWRIPGTVSYLEVLQLGERRAYADVEVEPEDIAFLQYTGGTTGLSKGAMLTHRNMVSNVLQAVAWARPAQLGASDRAATPLPLYHIFSLTANLLCFIELGGTNVLITNPRDLTSVIKDLKRAPVSYLTGVNTLFNALSHLPSLREVDFGRLKVAMGGGMAVQRSVAEAWQKITGKPVVQGYGLTEASPIVCVNPLDATCFSESIGLPLPSTEISIRDDDGKPLAANQTGEICVRGPQVMKGYWNDAAATAEVMLPGGWLRTGDIGRMDEDGFVFIEDRRKDLIIVSGFNVYPNELESVASMHPGVLEAAAIGVPDERSGEAIRLFVVRKDAKLTETELLEFFRQQVTGYKVPDQVVFRDELPKTNVGKVLRRALR